MNEFKEKLIHLHHCTGAKLEEHILPILKGSAIKLSLR